MKILVQNERLPAREILLYERKTLKVIVEITTGHCHLRKHLHTIGIASAKSGVWKRKQHTTVCECFAVKSIRVRLNGKPLLLPEEVMQEPLRKIARFASETGLLNSETEVV